MADDRPRRRGTRPSERIGVAVTNTTRARSAVATARLAALMRFVFQRERVRDALVSVTLISPRESARLNRAHLGHEGPTDVITFALDSAGPIAVVGDVYICPEVVRAQAVRHGVSVREELQRIVVHAALHVLGHEHPEGDGRERSPMWRRQERVLAAWLRRTAG